MPSFYCTVALTSFPFYWDLDRICPERKILPILSPKGWGREHLGLPHPPSSRYFKYLLLESTWQGEIEESTLPGLISTATWSTTEEVGKGGARRLITPAPAGWHSTAVVKNLRHNQSPTWEAATEIRAWNPNTGEQDKGESGLWFCS